MKKLKKYSDIELYDLAKSNKAKSAEAISILYDRYSAQVYKYCRRILGNEELAEDIFHDTFMRFYNTLSQDRDMTNVKGFLITVARNLCLSAKSSKHYGLSSLEDLELPTRDLEYEKKEIIEIVRTSIECLAIDLREPLVLKEYNGYSYQEIAEVLDLTLSVVKNRIYKAKQQLRKILEPYITEIIENKNINQGTENHE